VNQIHKTYGAAVLKGLSVGVEACGGPASLARRLSLRDRDLASFPTISGSEMPERETWGNIVSLTATSIVGN